MIFYMLIMNYVCASVRACVRVCVCVCVCVHTHTHQYNPTECSFSTFLILSSCLLFVKNKISDNQSDNVFRMCFNDFYCKNKKILYVRTIQTNTFCEDVLIFPTFLLFPEDEISNFLSK